MLMEKVMYRKFQDGDELEAFNIVSSGFHRFVEQDLTEEGTEEFFRAARHIIFEKPVGHTVFVAELNSEILGLIDVREEGHICLFFVDKEFQNRGIGRALLDRTVSYVFEDDLHDKMLDVNSSLCAVKAYERLGFIQVKDVQSCNGIKFVPMEKRNFD